MKKFLALLLLISFYSLTNQAFSQNKLKLGAHISTSFQLNSHRNKGTKIWSSESGYGFAAGVPLLFQYSDSRSLVTGLTYEYMAFDNRFNNSLVSSTRFHSLHIPLTINFDLISTFFLSAGTGINLNFRSHTFTPGSNVDISNNTNPIQPYVSLGVGSIKERGDGLFELGVQARYHLLDVWKKTYVTYAATSSKIISLDLVLRFYF